MLKKPTFSGIRVPHTFNHFHHFAVLTHNELKKRIKENRKRLETREVQSNFVIVICRRCTTSNQTLDVPDEAIASLQLSRPVI